MVSTPQYRLIKLPGYFVLSRVNDQVFSFDREHRIFHAWLDGNTYRIGLDGQVVEFKPGGVETFPVCRRCSESEKADLFGRLEKELGLLAQAPHASFLQEMEDFLPGSEAKAEIQTMREKLSPGSLAQQHRGFGQVYGSVPILPPDCYGSLLVQVTRGCAYNRCRFCTLYGDRTFEALSPEQLDEHLENIVKFQAQALDRWNSIFLGEANALSLDHETLVHLIQQIQGAFRRTSNPQLADHFYAFDDATAPKRSRQEYDELKAMGLKRVYIGLETGAWALRRKLLKPGDSDSFRAKVNALKQAGISVGIILLAGVGGEEHEDDHLEASTQVLTQLPLNPEDFVYVSPLRIQAHSSYPEWEKDADICPLDEESTWDQAYLLMDRIGDAFKNRRPRVAIYDLDRFVY